MATKLPAKRSSKTLAVPSDLDGFDVPKTLAFLGEGVESIREQRSRFGMGLWKLRCLLPKVEYEYHLGELADQLEVDMRTLYRWRIAAEAKHALPPPPREEPPPEPPPATIEENDSSVDLTDKLSARSPESTPSLPDKLSVSDGDEPEVLKVDDVLPAATEKGEGDPPSKKKPAQLSLFEEREGRLLVPPRPPSSREEAAEAKRIGRTYLDWAAQFQSQPTGQPMKVPSTPSEVAAFMKKRGKK